MALTYSTLITQVSQELERTDTVFMDNIPNFISQAQDIINLQVKNIGLEQVAIGAFTIGSAIVAKPTRWRRTISFNYGSGLNNNTSNILLPRRYEYLMTIWPNRTVSDVNQPPLYYSDYGFQNFLIAPTPALAYPFELIYMETPATLSVANQTNWLTDFAPALLFYRTLLQAVIYLKDDERVQTFGSIYKEIVDGMNGQDSMRQTDRSMDGDAD